MTFWAALVLIFCGMLAGAAGGFAFGVGLGLQLFLQLNQALRKIAFAIDAGVQAWRR